jgi:hypothetical protein
MDGVRVGRLALRKGEGEGLFRQAAASASNPSLLVEGERRAPRSSALRSIGLSIQ